MAMSMTPHDVITVLPQRRFVVRMECADGQTVSIRVTAATIESVVDQVRGRRLATPPGMTGFSVTDAGPA